MNNLDRSLRYTFLGMYLLLTVSVNIYYVYNQNQKNTEIIEASVLTVANNLSELISFPLKIDDQLSVIKNASIFAKLLPEGALFITKKGQTDPIYINPNNINIRICKQMINTVYVEYEGDKIGVIDYCFKIKQSHFKGLNLFVILFNSMAIGLIFWLLYTYLTNKSEYLRDIDRISKQVSHDIRSPIATLEMSLEYLEGVDSDLKEIISLAISRINSIASDLTNRTNESLKRKKIKKENINVLLQNILEQKRTQYKNNDIKFILTEHETALFSNITKSEMNRVLSNLLNNAIEALDKPKKEIKIEIIKEENSVILKIIDNGKGIPFEILENVFKYEVSHNKEQGSGLGLYHAKAEIERIGGKIEVSSIIGERTEIKISLGLAS